MKTRGANQSRKQGRFFVSARSGPEPRRERGPRPSRRRALRDAKGKQGARGIFVGERPARELYRGAALSPFLTKTISFGSLSHFRFLAIFRSLPFSCLKT